MRPRRLTLLSWWGGASAARCVPKLHMKHQRNIVAIQRETAAASPGHAGPSHLRALQLQTPRPPPLPVIRGMEEPAPDLSGCGFCLSLCISPSA